MVFDLKSLKSHGFKVFNFVEEGGTAQSERDKAPALERSQIKGNCRKEPSKSGGSAGGATLRS